MPEYKHVVNFWKEKKINTDAELSEALNAHSVNYAYNSGKIENENVTYHDTREIFDHDGVTSYTGDLRTLIEIKNAKAAYELFLAAFGEKRDFNEDFIKELQGCLTQNTYDVRRWQLGECPGEYKHHDYVIGREEVGAPPSTIREEMSELLEELQDIEDKDVLTAAAYFHAKFENIHPFADGNGRTGRLAMNYFLIMHNHPPVIIHEEDRREYYAALEAWDNEQSLKPLQDFLEWQTEKTWGRQLQRNNDFYKSTAELQEYERE